MQASTDSDHLFQHVLKCSLEWPPKASSNIFAWLEDKSDQALLKMFKQGTREHRRDAFTALYNRYYLDVWRYTRKQVYACEERARDVFADVWVIGFEKLDDFEWPEEDNSENSPLLRWLWETARRLSLQDGRERNGVACLDEESRHEIAIEFIFDSIDLDQPSSQFVPSEIQSEADLLLQKSLSTLKPVERRIIKLLYYHNKNSTEIGKLLNMKPGTIRRRHGLILPKLRKILTQNGYTN